MWIHDLRTLLLRALLLDWLGQVLILVFMLSIPAWTGIAIGGDSLQGQEPWLLFVLLLYPLLGWLFGSFTVLRRRRLAISVLLQRLLITASVTLMVVAVARWLFNPSDEVWLVYRRVQLLDRGAYLWALAVRVGLRRGVFLPEAPRMLLLAQPQELDMVMQAWRRVPQRYGLRPVDPGALAQQLDDSEVPLLVALTQAVRQDPELRPLLARLEICDPQHVRALSVLSLFEQQQERLPPVLLAKSVLAFDNLPWSATFSVQAQLKRMADLLLATVLLLLTALVFLAALFIWQTTGGEYAQQRSGWLAGHSLCTSCVR